jgi:hypothetical protein
MEETIDVRNPKFMKYPFLAMLATITPALRHGMQNNLMIKGRKRKSRNRRLRSVGQTG